MSDIRNIILVFNFRGPYTAQLTKLYLSRVKSQLLTKNVILVGEGLFSEKEFPIVAQEIYDMAPSKTFHKFFVNGQLRVDTLFPEEKALLKKFSELTGMQIKDMGQLDLKKAESVAQEILQLISSEELAYEEPPQAETNDPTWVCSVCGHRHKGATPPDKCPLCGVNSDRFLKQ